MVKEITREMFMERYPANVVIAPIELAVYLEDGTVLLDEDWNGEVYTVKTENGERVYQPLYKLDGENSEIIGYDTVF